MKKPILLLCVIAILLCCSCSTSAANIKQEQPLKIWAQNENGYFGTMVVVDDETSVNYVVVYGAYRGTVAICPRYNADGTLYTGKST